MKNDAVQSSATSLLFLLLTQNVILCAGTGSNPFDYTLYSHLKNELNNDHETIAGDFYDYAAESNDSPSHTQIFNFYKLNNETIGKYNEYLHFPERERHRLKQLAKTMFEFGYDNYMSHAFPLDELDPIHCLGRGPDSANPSNININDALGDYLLTLVDSLSSLVVFGNHSEFKRATRLVIDNLSFEKDSTVQVFEATIRILGGLISAHLIVTDVEQPFGNMTLPEYDNELLSLAHDLGVRLLMAFENKNSPLPYPRVSFVNEFF
jgi:hypothetical protein